MSDPMGLGLAPCDDCGMPAAGPCGCDGALRDRLEAVTQALERVICERDWIRACLETAMEELDEAQTELEQARAELERQPSRMRGGEEW